MSLLTIAQVRNDLLSKLGIEDPLTASTQVEQDVVVAINGAMQMLQTAGEQFFTQQEITVTLGAGTSVYTIGATVQSIVGEVRLNDQVPLRGMESRGQFDQFGRIFMGTQDFGAAPGQPLAYFPDFNRQGTTGKITSIILYVAPTPAAAGTLTMMVVNDAPSYTTADLSGSTVLPVAQGYTESVFLPIARMLVTRSSQFSRPDILDQLTEDYRRAMDRIATFGGFPNVNQQNPGRMTQS